MTRILVSIGRRRRVLLIVSRPAWYGLGIELLIGTAAWILLRVIAV